uniref:Secreted protein n=1 Tax=Equus asinus asinus TaxID=83772 RepID=A0A8C4MFA3_EQUAS
MLFYLGLMMMISSVLLPLVQIGPQTNMRTARSITTRKRAPAALLPTLRILTGITQRMIHACPTPVNMVGTASSMGTPSRAAAQHPSLETGVRTCKASARTTPVAEVNVSLLRVLPTTTVPADTLTRVKTAPQVSAGGPFCARLSLSWLVPEVSASYCVAVWIHPMF